MNNQPYHSLSNYLNTLTWNFEGVGVSASRNSSYLYSGGYYFESRPGYSNNLTTFTS